MIEFTIPGIPTGKGRPRFAKVGNFVRTYTPQKTEVYENKVAMSYRSVHSGPPSEEALLISIQAFFPIPKSWNKKKRAEHENNPFPVTKKPDIDNIVKAILDGLNTIAYNDDAQVCCIHCSKFYSVEPRTTVSIRNYKDLSILTKGVGW
jgi:Holliday junction resolvase RusA-like endonuclease